MVGENNDIDLSVTQSTEDKASSIWKLLSEVYDPEVPVLTIIDLGIVRGVHYDPLFLPAGSWGIIITPTYSGCPAMDVISMNIRMKLLEHGIKNFHIKTQLSPAWTTDWMSENGKAQLKAYGIAPPQGRVNGNIFGDAEAIVCPNCRSLHTRLLSEFGSTSCKALYQCVDCKEPFDYFKCH